MATISTNATSVPSVDVTALKVNQSLIVALVAGAFVLGTERGGIFLVLLVAASLAIGAAWPGYGPFQLLYRRLLRPLGILSPNPRPDEQGPHRFAQSLGATFLLLAAVFLGAGAGVVGWTLAWLVVALALVNLLFGFCAGCFAFYHLRRVGRRFGGGV